MRRVAIVPILVVLLFTAGCQSKPSQPETAPEPPTAKNESPAGIVPAVPVQPDPVDDPRPRIVCFGDSLTAGYGTEPGQAYPDYLQVKLDKLGYSYRVVNSGVSGNTTKDGVERVQRVITLKPVLVVVEFGGNDGLRGLRIVDTRDNLDNILSALTASGTKVVIAGITLPPDYGPDYIRQFNETYSLLAKKYRVPMLPFLLKGVFGTAGMMQADRTHATAAGNQVVAQNVLELIKPQLKKP